MNQAAKERDSVGLRGVAVGVAQATLWGLLAVAFVQLLSSLPGLFHDLPPGVQSVTIGFVDLAFLFGFLWLAIRPSAWTLFAPWGLVCLLSLARASVPLKCLCYCLIWLLTFSVALWLRFPSPRLR